jgi:hypothetical protein
MDNGYMMLAVAAVAAWWLVRAMWQPLKVKDLPDMLEADAAALAALDMPRCAATLRQRAATLRAA